MDGKEFYESELIQNLISKIKEGGIEFVCDDDQGINSEEFFGKFLNCFNEKVCEKSFEYFLEILEKDNDDFLTFQRCRKSSWRSYSTVVSELFIFTALRYHPDNFEDYARKLNEGTPGRVLLMYIAQLEGDYTEAFKKKGKSKKGK